MNKFGGELKHPASQGKNELATGGGAENLSSEVSTQNELNKSVHLDVHISGPGADSIDWFHLLKASGEENYQITKMDIKMYYSTQDNKVK